MTHGTAGGVETNTIRDAAGVSEMLASNFMMKNVLISNETSPFVVVLCTNKQKIFHCHPAVLARTLIDHWSLLSDVSICLERCTYVRIRMFLSDCIHFQTTQSPCRLQQLDWHHTSYNTQPHQWSLFPSFTPTVKVSHTFQLRPLVHNAHNHAHTHTHTKEEDSLLLT